MATTMVESTVEITAWQHDVVRLNASAMNFSDADFTGYTLIWRYHRQKTGKAGLLTWTFGSVEWEIVGMPTEYPNKIRLIFVHNPILVELAISRYNRLRHWQEFHATEVALCWNFDQKTNRPCSLWQTKFSVFIWSWWTVSLKHASGFIFIPHVTRAFQLDIELNSTTRSFNENEINTDTKVTNLNWLSGLHMVFIWLTQYLWWKLRQSINITRWNEANVVLILIYWIRSDLSNLNYIRYQEMHSTGFLIIHNCKYISFAMTNWEWETISLSYLQNWWVNIYYQKLNFSFFFYSFWPTNLSQIFCTIL